MPSVWRVEYDIRRSGKDEQVCYCEVIADHYDDARDDVYARLLERQGLMDLKGPYSSFDFTLHWYGWQMLWAETRERLDTLIEEAEMEHVYESVLHLSDAA